MSNLSESCKGCYFNLDCIIKNGIAYYELPYVCKCTTCLIKGICKDNCEEIDILLCEIASLEKENGDVIW